MDCLTKVDALLRKVDELDVTDADPMMQGALFAATMARPHLNALLAQMPSDQVDELLLTGARLFLGLRSDDHPRQWAIRELDQAPGQPAELAPVEPAA